MVTIWFEITYSQRKLRIESIPRVTPYPKEKLNETLSNVLNYCSSWAQLSALSAFVSTISKIQANSSPRISKYCLNIRTDFQFWSYLRFPTTKSLTIFPWHAGFWVHYIIETLKLCALLLSNEENAGNVTLFDAAMIPLGENCAFAIPSSANRVEGAWTTVVAEQQSRLMAFKKIRWRIFPSGVFPKSLAHMLTQPHNPDPDDLAPLA